MKTTLSANIPQDDIPRAKQGSAPLEPASNAFPWAKCVAAVTETDIEQLATWRGFSPNFVRWLKLHELFGLFNQFPAFPLHNEQGAVVGCHYRKGDGTWRYGPHGLKHKTWPLIIGDLAKALEVHAFESQWDGLSLLDKLEWHFDGIPGDTAIVITRGAENGKLLAGLIPANAELVAWPQNDPPRENGKEPPAAKWLRDIQAVVGRELRVVCVPGPNKDLNDWCKAGASAATLTAAIELSRAEEPTGAAKAASPDAPPEVFSSGTPAVLALPSGSVSISESARAIFAHIAPSRTLFWRGGALVELVDLDGTPTLSVLQPDAFRSRVERHGKLFAWRLVDGKPVLAPALMPRDTAAALLATAEARELLPPIASVLSCPVIVEAEAGQVAILGKGYHPQHGGLLVTGGELPPQVAQEEAAASLRWLVEEFVFQSEGDRSRALAALITPALRIGCFLKGNVPLDAAEADQSQSGKLYRHDLVCSLHRERAYVVTARQGGVGSVDESFAAALVAGRPFIMLDNLRGRLDSQHLESFLTAPGTFPARVPHRGEIMVDPKCFLIQLSSNGVSATRDLVNRSSICRIRKRPGFAYRDTIGELRARQPYFLGCVFSLIAEWVAAGKPRTKDCRHDFREWCQVLDWICQNLLEAAPLMDGHVAAQERAANPALTWLRAVALAVASEGRLPATLTASEICEVCDQHGVDLPGESKDAPPIQAGRLLAKVFKESPSADVDGFQITKEVRQVHREEGGAIEAKSYTFTKP
jgi:hypothetical protein